MINGPLVHGKLRDEKNRFRTLATAGKDNPEIVTRAVPGRPLPQAERSRAGRRHQAHRRQRRPHARPGRRLLGDPERQRVFVPTLKVLISYDRDAHRLLRYLVPNERRPHCVQTHLQSTLLPSSRMRSASSAPAAEPRQLQQGRGPDPGEELPGLPRSRKPKGGYQLFTFELLHEAGRVGATPSVTPSKPDDSELFSLIAETDKDLRMPKDGDPLPAEQIALIKRWIDEGAKYDSPDPKATLASIVPKAAAARSAGGVSPPGADHGRGLQPGRQGAGRRRLSRSHDLERGRRHAAAAHQERAPSASTVWPTRRTARCWPWPAARRARWARSSSSIPPTARWSRSWARCATWASRRPSIPPATKLAACAADRTIRIFDVASGKEETSDRRPCRLGHGHGLEPRRHAAGLGQPRQDRQGVRRRRRANRRSRTPATASRCSAWPSPRRQAGAHRRRRQEDSRLGSRRRQEGRRCGRRTAKCIRWSCFRTRSSALPAARPPSSTRSISWPP